MKSSAEILKAMRSPPPAAAGGSSGAVAADLASDYAAITAPMPEPSASSPGKKSPNGKGSPKSGKPKVLTLKGIVPLNLGLDRVMTVRTGGRTPEFDALVPPGGQPGQIWHFKVEVGEPGERWTIVESIEFEDPPDPHALPGAGVVYRCVSRAVSSISASSIPPTLWVLICCRSATACRLQVLRAGLDRMSKIVGYAERGEELVSLETRVYSGRIRVRFERGWSSVVSGSGKTLFKKRPGLKPWVQEE
eukprot:SAG31_NODE_14707_length_791_cov_1.258671_1_plen_247_part_01